MAKATTRLHVRVAPGAGRDEIIGRLGSAWKIRVSAPPERGKANDAVLRLLSERLRIAASGLTLVSGHASRDKIVELHGLSAREAEQRLANVT